MAVKVELPKEILNSALEQAIAIRKRNANAATNSIIKQALEEEISKIQIAKGSLHDIK